MSVRYFTNCKRFEKSRNIFAKSDSGLVSVIVTEASAMSSNGSELYDNVVIDG
jgi:hypothetical protein